MNAQTDGQTDDSIMPRADHTAAELSVELRHHTRDNDGGPNVK